MCLVCRVVSLVSVCLALGILSSMCLVCRVVSLVSECLALGIEFNVFSVHRHQCFLRAEREGLASRV